jgi:hypothetical protein
MKIYPKSPTHDPNSDRWFIDYVDEDGKLSIRIFCYAWEDCHKKINSHWRPLLTARKMTDECRRIYDWVWKDDPHWARDLKCSFEFGDVETFKKWKTHYLGRLVPPGKDSETDYYREKIEALEIPVYREQLALPI